MSIRAQVAAWAAVIAAAGVWSWHLGRFNGLQVVAILAAVAVVAWLAWRGIDSQAGPDVDRMADPTPLPTDRRQQ